MEKRKFILKFIFAFSLVLNINNVKAYSREFISFES